MKWLRLAAGQGDAQSGFQVGATLADGRGVVMDLLKKNSRRAVRMARLLF